MRLHARVLGACVSRASASPFARRTPWRSCVRWWIVCAAGRLEEPPLLARCPPGGRRPATLLPYARPRLRATRVCWAGAPALRAARALLRTPLCGSRVMHVLCIPLGLPPPVPRGCKSPRSRPAPSCSGVAERRRRELPAAVPRPLAAPPSRRPARHGAVRARLADSVLLARRGRRRRPGADWVLECTRRWRLEGVVFPKPSV